MQEDVSFHLPEVDSGRQVTCAGWAQQRPAPPVLMYLVAAASLSWNPGLIASTMGPCASAQPLYGADSTVNPF